MHKIKLEKKLGPIVFLGSSNAMTMMYAWELKKLGYEVLYFVDATKDQTLGRPENHFPDINYPYPNWIIELNIITQMLIPFNRTAYIKYIIRKIKLLGYEVPVQAYILNGFFISLATLLSSPCKIISIPHGSDMTAWANEKESGSLASSFYTYSIFKYLPSYISKKLIPLAVKQQYLGFKNSDVVVSFPYGFNNSTDQVIDSLKKDNVKYYERYDISFEPLKYQSRDFKVSDESLVVFSGVRFLYDTFSEGSSLGSKGNDIMIKGLAKFYSKHKNLTIHFVEKGPDVKKAKKLCKDLGLATIVIWHKEMKFKDLLSIYNEADICFDQVGSHWIAAIGGYSMWLGKPLIANDTVAVKSGIWPEDNPICSATNADEVCDWLHKLTNTEFRMEVSEQSKFFVEKYMSPSKVINDIFDLS